MRIRVIQTPAVPCIDGIRLDWFRPGLTYEVGTLLGAYLLAEGWAEPVNSAEPTLLLPLAGEPEIDLDPTFPPNLKRELFPPYYDGPALVVDRPRRRRR